MRKLQGGPSEVCAADDRGATAVEYALLLSVIVLTVALAAIALAAVLDDPFTAASNCLQDIAQCPR